MELFSNLEIPIALTIALILLVAAIRLRHRITIGEDFAIGRRRLPAWLAGLSQAINGMPLWLLLALSAHAYVVGLAAVWMAIAFAVGVFVNWWLIAPRVRKLAAAQDGFSLSQLIAANTGERRQAFTLRSAAAIVMFTLGLATLTLLQWAAQRWVLLLSGSYVVVIVLLALLLVVIAACGGLWSASYSDAVQASVVWIVYLLTAAGLFITVGGWQTLWVGLRTHDRALELWFNGYSGVLAIAFVVGVVFAAFSSIAQPQVISRYLACKDDKNLKQARLISLAWTVCVLISALLIGWCARLSFAVSSSPGLLQDAMTHAFPIWMVSILAMLALIALSIASISSWVAVATHLATDIRRPDLSTSPSSARESLSLVWCRGGLVFFVLLVTLAAIYLPITDNGEDRLWFCWHALGAAFGPLLLVRLSGKKVRPGSSLGAMWSGFILTGMFHLMPDTPGDLLERSLPFIAAMGIALSGGERRRNPDRADRGDKTVHDHLPI